VASDAPISHHGKHYQFDDVAITPKPCSGHPGLCRGFSRPSIELAGRLGCNLIVAPFAAALTFGGLQQMVEVYREPARDMPSAGRLCAAISCISPTRRRPSSARARQIATTRNAPPRPFRATRPRRRRLPLFHRDRRSAAKVGRRSDREFGMLGTRRISPIR